MKLWTNEPLVSYRFSNKWLYRIEDIVNGFIVVMLAYGIAWLFDLTNRVVN